MIKQLVMAFGLCCLVASDYVSPMQVDGCGLPPNTRRLVTGGARSSSKPIWPLIYLRGIDRIDGRGRVVIEVHRVPGVKPEWYASTDRGVDWIMLDSNPCTSIPHYGELFRCFRSRAFADILCRSAQYSRAPELELSKDGGRQWTRFSPHNIGGERVTELTFIETSPNDPGRVYGLLSTTDSKKRGLYLSNDFGQSFQPLFGLLSDIVESRAEPNTLFGLRWNRDNHPQHMLMLSRNGGQTWLDKPASVDTCSPFYRDQKSHVIRSWRESLEDFELIPPDPIYQIETDPSDHDTLYILSFNGLYRSVDGGDSFMLLPLATDKILSIDAIAVDPNKGNCIYAVVETQHLFLSSDKGCHWQEVRLPTK